MVLFYYCLRFVTVFGIFCLFLCHYNRISTLYYKNSRGYPVVSELFFKQKIEIFLFNKLFGTDVIILWHSLPIAVS